MAKLNVEVLDMVSGEITKVAYDGVEYELLGTDVKAKAGDLVQSNVKLTDISEGDFFKTFNCDGDIEFKEGGNDYRDANYGEGRYIIFRKISAEPSPTLEERVTDLETKVAALEGENVEAEPKRLTVGDIAKIIDEESGHSGNVGDVVRIVADDEDDQPYKCTRISDGKDVGWFFESELEAYAEETIEFEGATYRKVDREAREGDVIVLSRVQANETTHVTAGKPYKVSREIDFVVDNGDKYDVYFNTLGRTRETVDVYEAKYAPQVGDIVVVTKPGTHRFNVDDTVKIYANVESGRNPYRGQYADKSSPSRNYLCDFEVRKATPTEVEAYEKAAHKASFAVGDYVKVVRSYRNLEGVIAKVTQVGEFNTTRGVADFVIEHLPKKDGRFAAMADQIVKATDAEIAKATAPKLKAGDFVKFKEDGIYIIAGKAYEVFHDYRGLYFVDDNNYKRWHHFDNEYEIVDAETAKWEKLGRKVNEFKKGDVVRVINVALTGLEGYKGVVTTIDNTKDDGCPYHVVKPRFVNNGNDTWLFGKDLELIAPVESTVAS